MKKRRKPPKKNLDCLYKRVYIGRVNDGRQNDFSVLRSRFERELKDAENKVRTLKAKLNNLAELERDAKNPANDDLPKEYADLGLTEAILKSISDLVRSPQHNNIGANVAAIKQRMLAHGFFPTGQKFDIAVSVTLKRLRDSDRVTVARLGDEYFYKPVEK
jgi:hypothetical protein